MLYLVSACLAGLRSRHDGTDALQETVKALLQKGLALPLCPEQLGGLGTPREAVEFSQGDGQAVLQGLGRVVGVESGQDFTQALLRGARECLRLAELYGLRLAVLKDGSPSCGPHTVYRDGAKVRGMGVTAALLKGRGIRVLSPQELGQGR
jgi:uncharacterized protein YbbK (DUF523 family)